MEESSAAAAAAEADPLAQSLSLVSSLLNDELPTVQHLKGKWSLARVKLSLLQTELTQFSSESGDALSLHLLTSILHTLNDALSLARQSQSPHLPNGKLKTQNDLDSLLSLLHRHLSDCHVLLNNQHDAAAAAVPSKRSESRNLITRLQIGSPESRTSAMDSLLTLLQEDDKNVTIAVAQGVVPVLARLLDSPSSSSSSSSYSAAAADTKEKTVAAISLVAAVDAGRQVLIAEGLLLLNHLLRVLDSGSGFAIERACVALQALSSNKENAMAIGSRGGISSLLEICQSGTPGSQASAAGVLRNLAKSSEIRENFVEENALVVLLGLASSGTVLAQENAIGCLSNLVSNCENLRISVVKEGGVRCLKNFWDNSSHSMKSLEVAVEMLGNLASSSPIAEVLVSEGFVERLVSVLNSGILALRISGARAVYALGLNSVKARKDFGECGCIAVLTRMLDGKGVEEKEASAKALSVLLLHSGNRKVFRKEERGVVSAVHLLNPSVQNLDKRYPVSLLGCLVQSKGCRKQMVAAGACVYAQKLVEMDVEGSKKLLDSLGRGKIWGVFARP